MTGQTLSVCITHQLIFQQHKVREMIKHKEKASVVGIQRSTDTEIALIKKDIEIIKDNHLYH